MQFMENSSTLNKLREAKINATEFARTNFNLINSNKDSYRSVKAISPNSRHDILIHNFTYFLIDC